MSDSSDDNRIFSFVYFMKFLDKHDVLTFAVAAVLADKMSGVLDSLIDTFVLSIINRDSDNDGEEDIKKLEDVSVDFSGINFCVGKVIVSLIRFILVAFFLYILMHYIDKTAKTMNMN